MALLYALRSCCVRPENGWLANVTASDTVTSGRAVGVGYGVGACVGPLVGLGVGLLLNGLQRRYAPPPPADVGDAISAREISAKAARMAA